MKNTILKNIVTGLALVSLISCIHAFSEEDNVSKYYKAFDHPTDGTGRLLLKSKFIEEVPVDQRTNVLIKILEKASSEQPPNYNIIGRIFSLLEEGDFGSKITWNENLENLVDAQIKSPDKWVRLEVVRLLAQKQKDKSRDIILSFQNDSDDQVRGEVMNSIKKWPDAGSIYDQYISAHESDLKYAHSVQQAKICSGKYPPIQSLDEIK